jgi:hypothetical protein
VATLVAGCGAQTDSAPRTVATAFTYDLTHGDPGRACELLAPETRSALEQSAGRPCARAITEENLPPPGALRHFAMFGAEAQARYANDVLFLAEFKGGWRVTAAGCTPHSGRPYDCRLQGG